MKKRPRKLLQKRFFMGMTVHTKLAFLLTVCFVLSAPALIGMNETNKQEPDVALKFSEAVYSHQASLILAHAFIFTLVFNPFDRTLFNRFVDTMFGREMDALKCMNVPGNAVTLTFKKRECYANLVIQRCSKIWKEYVSYKKK